LLLLALLLAGLGAGCSVPRAAGSTSDDAAKYQGYVEVGSGIRL